MNLAARRLMLDTTVSFPSKKQDSRVRAAEVLPPVIMDRLNRGRPSVTRYVISRGPRKSSIDSRSGKADSIPTEGDLIGDCFGVHSDGHADARKW